MHYYKKRPNRCYNLKDVYRWLLQAGWEVESHEIADKNNLYQEHLILALHQPSTKRIKNVAVTTEVIDELL